MRAQGDRATHRCPIHRWQATIVVAMAMAMLAAGPAQASPRPFATGIANLDSAAPLAFQRTRAAGAQFVRIPLYWGGAAPDAEPASWNPEDPEDPNYRWDATDEEVAHAVQAGLTPMLQVDGAPLWAQRCTTPAVLAPAICDPDPSALRAFAVAAAKHYSGNFAGVPRVQYWQGLNEPNLSLFFFPQFSTDGKLLSPDLYRVLTNSYYAGIKAADPSNLVVLGGLGPNAVPKWTIGPMQFARVMLCMTGVRRPHPIPGDCGGGVYFDIFAIQPYSTGSATHEGGVNDVQIGDLPKLQRLIQAADRAGRIKGQFRRTPLWVTEFSWDSQPPDPGGLPMRILTHWSAEALFLAWKAGVTHLFWYSLRDGKREAGQPYSQTLESGLYFRGASLAQDQPKEVLEVFHFPFVAFPTRKGLSYWGRTPDSTSGKVVIQRRTKRGWRRVTSVHTDRFGTFRGRARSRYGKHRRGSVRAFFEGQKSPPFLMRSFKDFRHMPFGDPTG
jgi:hypothetical protein